MDYNDLNLRNRTIYDFTDDSKVIKEITGSVSKASYIETCHIINKMGHIADFADMIQDEELHKLVIKAFKAVQKEWDSIVTDGLKGGIIID